MAASGDKAPVPTSSFSFAPIIVANALEPSESPDFPLNEIDGPTPLSGVVSLSNMRVWMIVLPDKVPPRFALYPSYSVGSKSSPGPRT